MNFITGYIGTYTVDSFGHGKGIYSFRMDPASGGIDGICLAAEADNPSWLCLRGRNLYAANELTPGAVSSYRTARDGSLEFINQQASGGIWPCHLALGRYIIAANYGSGTIAVFPIEPSGGIGGMCQLIQLDGSGPDRMRQEGPHAHAALFDAGNAFVYVHDLGSDRIMTYRCDLFSGQPLQAAEFPWYKSTDGAGPRHGVFNADGSCLYSVNELDSTLDVLRREFPLEHSGGRLEKIQSLSTLPASVSGIANFPAEICVSPDGKFVCVSNRGHDSIAVYAIHETGTLNFIDAFPGGGEWPRHFTFDPAGNFILAANQKSDTITVFSFDKLSGALKQTGTFPVPSPACVVFDNSVIDERSETAAVYAQHTRT